MTTFWLGIHNGNHLLTSAQGAFMQQEHAERWARLEDRRRIYPVTLMPTHRHYKGGEYAYIGEGMHTETEEPLTAYINEKGLWFRPTPMFHGSVDENGYQPRFTLL